MSLALEPIPQSVQSVLQSELEQFAGDHLRVAEDFFGLADLLGSDARMRRALSDPARSAAEKGQLIDNAFGASLTAPALTVLKEIGATHWSRPDDLPEAVEGCGAHAVLHAAHQGGALKETEEELLHVHDFLGDHRELRVGLSDLGGGSAHERAQLALSLLDGKINPYTLRLVRRAVGRTEHGRLLSKLRTYAKFAASLQGLVLVTVETAHDLNEAQHARLQSIMEKRLGAPVTLAVSINPELQGGFRLHAGNEAVDASIAARISDLRRTLDA